MNVSKVLADMALELEQQRSTQESIDVVCRYACEVLDADDAGILMITTRQDVKTPAATGPGVHAAHQLQAEYDEGPCLDAIDGKATYLTQDVETDPRWPQWGPAAARLGYHSAIGVRLATRDRGYGSLNVYAKRKNAFDTDAAEVVEMLAAHATAALASSSREEGLMTAVETRTIIGQAQGILMQKFDIDADAAFQFLRRISQHENLKLADVAEAIATQRNANARPDKH